MEQKYPLKLKAKVQNIFSRKEEPKKKKKLLPTDAGDNSLGSIKIISDKFLDLHKTMKSSGNDTYMSKHKRNLFQFLIKNNCFKQN